MGIPNVLNVRNGARNIVTAGVFTALLIGAQFALSGIAGVEFVTVLLLVFCYNCGVRQGMLVANAFTILRCVLFGFMPTVILLYAIYYNLFAVLFGLVGKAFKRKYSIAKHAALVLLAVAMTALFTVIDNIITPLFFEYSTQAAKAYWLTSLYTAVPQMLCALITTLCLFPPLLKLLQVNHIGIKE